MRAPWLIHHQCIRRRYSSCRCSPAAQLSCHGYALLHRAVDKLRHDYWHCPRAKPPGALRHAFRSATADMPLHPDFLSPDRPPCAAASFFLSVQETSVAGEYCADCASRIIGLVWESAGRVNVEPGKLSSFKLNDNALFEVGGLHSFAAWRAA